MTEGIEIAVVGARPAGLYAVAELAVRCPGARVDVFGRMPVPFGLVRYGIAPDHVRTKRVTDLLRRTLERSNVRFLGGVEIGSGVPVEDLARCYDGIVLATGAPQSARLGIAGEGLPGSMAAVDFMAWANAHPDATAPALDCPAAAIVGAGNVALDVARLLLAPPEDLVATDMPPDVLDAFAASEVRDVHLLSRGGPAQARFTAKELLEVGAAAHVQVIVDSDLVPPDSGTPPLVPANLEALQQLKALQAAPIWKRAGRRLWLHFDSRPVRIIGHERVAGLEVTGRMSGVLHAGLIVRAIGHQSIPVGTVPFDRATGRIVHDGARVPASATTGTPVYVAGWARRGATGVVATNRACASTAVARLLDDVAKRTSRPARRHADELLEQRGIKPVSYGGWTAIDAEERSRGRQAGKQRVKVGTWSELQAVATSCSAPAATP